MKVLSAKAHGFLDYGLSFLLVGSPWFLGFYNDSNPATLTMLTIGVLIFALSLLTNYPLGLFKAISFPTHGAVETAGAIGLMASPWLMNFYQVLPARNEALLLGMGYLIVILFTNYSSYQSDKPRS